MQSELIKWKGLQKFPPGHFHSPVIGREDLVETALNKSTGEKTEITGIELNLPDQESLFRMLAAFYPECPFTATQDESANLRYYFDNGFYSYSDGIILYCLLRYLRPHRYIEVGSGFSSCLVLDVNEVFLENSISCTFIEPHAERLISNMRSTDAESVKLYKKRVQDIDIGIFDTLESGDILFIDSSHVSKYCSDVNILLFEVLPRLRSGVWVHFHDIFYPFEYPSEWLKRGWSWNEAYILRAFLSYNPNFQIKLWGDALAKLRPEMVNSLMPKCLLNTGAGIWLQRSE